MAIQVVFYKFGKKINSTKRPDAETESVTYSCNMLDDCSIINPKISIAGADNTFNPSKYNYAYIASYDSRYYFVSDWTYSQGLWIASLTEDVLASWRGNIGTSSQYILRAENASVINPNISDANYPTQCIYDSQETLSSSNPFVSGLTNGTIILGIIGNSPTYSNRVTPVNYYAMTVEAFTFFFKTFLSSTDFVAQVVTGLLNPLEYIVSCQWFPSGYNKISTAEQTKTIYMGWWPLPQQFAVKELNPTDFTMVLSTTFNLPKHGKTDLFGNWVNKSPFTNRFFIWEPIGVIPLDTTIIQNTDPAIIVQYNIDLTTGLATYNIVSGQTSHLAIGSFQCGINLPLSQSSIDIGSLFTNATNSAISLAAGNYIGFVGNVVNGVSQAIPQYEKTGSLNSFSPYTFSFPVVRSDFVRLPEQSVSTYGRPAYVFKQISSVPGYIQTGNAHLEIAATDNEIDQIISYMNGGFYYE